MPYFTFISHCGEDTWVAQQLSKACAAAGAETFLDEAHITIGATFEKEILAALEQANELLVLVTPWALTRPYVWVEIGAAWIRKIPIVVLLHGMTPAEFQKSPNFPVILKERNLLALKDVDRYFTELKERAVNDPKQVAIK
jgi:hypothetical protein